jgi:hypothetical protein
VGAFWVATGAGGRNWWAVSLLVVALASVVSLLVAFVRVLVNREGALDRTVEWLTRLPRWLHRDKDPEELRRSQQFSAAAGVALLVAIAMLLGGLLMDQLTS